MSLPLAARWEYVPEIGAEAGSREAELVDALKRPREWATV
jgi:coproporphyrinogen III oxidase